MIIERGNRYFSYSLPSKWFEARHFVHEVAVNIDFRGFN
jgi:hypothetical protein